MLRERTDTLRRVHLGMDVFLTAAAFVLAIVINVMIHPGDLRVPSDQLNAQNIIVVMTIWGILIYRQKQAYVYRMKPYGELVRNIARTVVLGTLLFGIWLFATRTLTFGRAFFMLFILLDFTLLFCFRAGLLALLHRLRRKGYNYQTVLVVGTGDLAKKIVDRLKDNPQWGFKVMGLLDFQEMSRLWRYRDIPLIGSLSQLPQIIQNNQVDYVLFAVPHQYLDEVDSSILLCEEMGTKAMLLADFFSTHIAKKRITEFLGQPAVVYSTTPDYRYQIAFKAILDRVLALVGLAVASPLLLITALLVRVTSRGPVLFRQVRCGLNGRRFTVYKFRTMVDNAEKLKSKLLKYNEMDGPAFKIEHDPRITPIGSFLRKSSIDELPQLINVMRGEMSLVGPRPPLPNEVERYDRWQRRKLSMKPGLTCLWQVGGRNDTTFEEWMKLDLQYIDNWSLWLDTKILLRTIPAVVAATGK